VSTHLRRLRVVPVAAATWVVAAIVIHVPVVAPWLSVALWSGVIGLLIAVAVRTPRTTARRRMLLLTLLALSGAAAAASHVALAVPARDALDERVIQGGRSLAFDLVVTGKVESRAEGMLSFDAHVHSVRIGGDVTALGIDATVRVAAADVEGPRGALDVGARVTARGTASPADAGDRAVVRVSAGRGLEVTRPPEGILAVAATLRQGLVASVVGLPGPGAGLVPGLAVGDTSIVSAELDELMKLSSLSHLTAVSGANCALVVGIAYALAAAAGAGRRTRVAAGALALAGFVVLVTPEPSVVRAATMAFVAMVGLLLGRTGAGMAVLALAVTILLAMDPWLSASLGFALSAVATGSLLVFARPLAAGMSRGMPQSLALALSVPLAAQLACGPLLVLIAPHVPLYGVLANLLAAPAAPVATIVGLLACLAAPLPLLQAGLVGIAWVPASWIAATAETAASLPGNLVPWIGGWWGAALLAAVGAAVGVLIAVGRSDDRRRRRLRAVSGLLVAVTVGVGAGMTALTSVIGSWTIPPQWSVIACDVGQGDAVLVRSAGAVALIDTGPDPDALDECLRRTGVSHIDLLVLTHFDADHAGGVDAVLGRVSTVLHGPTADAAHDAAVAGLADAGARVHGAAAGLSGALGDARWRVLWPRADDRAFPAGNDASTVLEFVGGGVPALLLLGDLSASAQRAFLAGQPHLSTYPVVKVAHHGSADQEPRLYVVTDPALALVTVGENTYGHPRDEILDVLDTVGASIARTDREGMIAVWLEGERLRVWRERVAGPG
jgi:competence protein ComEC